MTDYNVASKTVKAVRIDASSTNIPTAFSTAAGSLLVTGVSRADVFTIVNTSTSRLAVNYTHGDSASAPTLVDLYVPAAVTGSFSAIVLDNCQLSSTVYIKSDEAAAISSGIVTVSVG